MISDLCVSFRTVVLADGKGTLWDATAFPVMSHFAASESAVTDTERDASLFQGKKMK